MENPGIDLDLEHAHSNRGHPSVSRPRAFLRLAALAVLVASVGAASPLRAQTSPMTPTNADGSPAGISSPSTAVPWGTGVPLSERSDQEGAIDPARYILGPGDGLVLSILGRVSLDVPTEVDPEGYLWIPDFGRLPVAGLTLEQARKKVRERFHGGSRGIEPELRLVRLRKFKVYVTGEVKQPGSIVAQGVTRVSEAIERAGGLLDGASSRNVVVRGRDGGTHTADLVRFERTGDPADNPSVLDGDHILVPRRGPTIAIYAPVAYPGIYEFRSGDRLSDLLALAGPFRAEAALDRATLLRFRDDRQVDTLRVELAAPAGTADLGLQAGDRLFVAARGDYHTDRNVSVTGEVLRPGIYPIVEGVDRVSQLVERAGGVLPEGNRNSVLVVRRAADSRDRDPEFDRLSRLTRAEMTDNEYQTFRTKLASARATHTVDLDLISADTTAGFRSARERDVRLEPGDVISVERRPHSIQVGGEVKWPGLLTYDSSLKGGDYIALVGGYSGRARQSGTRVTRATSGQTILLKDAGRIEPGDLIYVPEKQDVNTWGVFRDALLVVGSIATVVLAFRR